MHRSVSVLALLALSGSAGQASAQLRLDRYMAPPSPTDGFRVARPVGLDAGQLGGLLVLDYADDPLVLELERGLEGTETTRLVNSQLEAHARLAYGINERLLIGGGIDFAVMMVGDSYQDAASGTTLAPADGAGLGDGHLGARYVLLGAVDSPASLALAANVSLPLANGANSDQSLSGEQGATFHPELLGEVRAGGLRITSNLGTLVRKDTTLLDTQMGDEITAGVGAGLRLPGRMSSFELMAELYGATAIADPFARNVTPVEAIAGGRWHPSEQWLVSLAAGPGMGRGIGSPDLRAIASLGFVGATASDFEEPAILDTDGDGDGVHEPLDRCPAEAEDADSFDDQDGCPDLDNDADGVVDTMDRCVGELEDRDGFEDVDGCPDTDNDKDTVLDGSDQCPEQAEDVDTFQDADGCPDGDNDADGVLDGDDACPAQAGTPENKGCAQVVVEGNQIRLTERIEFDKNGAEILPGSEPILEQVRALLEKNPQIQAVAIEGHTDGTGGVAHNQALSERRALSVVDWLARHGIAAERLAAHGCGNKRRLADESTEEGLRKNRRVELHIVEGAERSAVIDGCVRVPYTAPRRP